MRVADARRTLWWWRVTTIAVLAVSFASGQEAMRKSGVTEGGARTDRPKLVVMIVVDQMRADYVDKFQSQWNGGLKRLIREGAWFRDAAYPYSATETCVGHSTISTGSFPMSHGMVANSWWDRDSKKAVTCTSDPNVTNVAYGGGTTSGGDSAWRMLIPSYAEELKFQSGGATRVVTFSLKARAALMLAGHKASAATWFDTSTGAWVTSAGYGPIPFIEKYVNEHPVSADYGKAWSLSLPTSEYWYAEKAESAGTVDGWGEAFPFPLRGKSGEQTADKVFYQQWATSPYADTYLTKFGEAAIDALNLGKGAATDYLGISYSSTDYVGHTFGPRSWEIQDMLVRLDKDLGELFAHLDQKVGRGRYVVALSADHGVAPIPAQMASTGFDTGILNMDEVKGNIERILEPFDFGKAVVADVSGSEIYFTPEVHAQLRHNPAAMKAVLDAVLSTRGVAEVFRAEELASGARTSSPMRTAEELSFYAPRSGDLFVVQKPYWLVGAGDDAKQHTGTGHGTPYYYDQRVPILMMGFGIAHGEYFTQVTPADIAPTFAALTGITLATHDGRMLSEALRGHATESKPQ